MEDRIKALEVEVQRLKFDVILVSITNIILMISLIAFYR